MPSAGEGDEPSSPSRWSRARLGLGLVVAVLVSAFLFSGTSPGSAVSSLTKGMRGAAAFPTPLSLKKSSSSTTEESVDTDASTTSTTSKDKEETVYGATVTSTISVVSGLGSGSWSTLGAYSSNLNTYYVTDSSTGQFKATTDAGSTFTTTTPFTYTYGGSTAVISISQLVVTSTGTVLASSKYSNKYGGGQNSGKIYLSSNSGSTWSTSSPQGTSTSTYSYICVGVSASGNYILTADEWQKTAFVSSNSASSWGTGYTLASTPTACAVSSTGQYMFILSASGVYVSSTYGASWTLTTSALASTATATSISNSSSGNIVLATAFQSCYISKDYGASFSLMTNCLDQTYASTESVSSVSGVVSADGSNIAIIEYHEQYSALITYPTAYSYLRTSQDLGQSWASNKYSTGLFWFPTKLVSNTDMSSLVITAPTKSYNYMGYKTYTGYGYAASLKYTTYAPTTKPTASPTTTAAPSVKPTAAPSMGQISGIAVGSLNYWSKVCGGYSDQTNVFAISSLTTDAYVYKSSNKGATWSQLTSSKNVAGNTALTCSTYDAKYVYTAFDRTSTTSSKTNAGIAVSKDYGVSWTKVTLSCTDCQYTGLATDYTGQYVFAAGGQGLTIGGSGDLVYSADYGSTYTSLGSGVGSPSFYAVSLYDWGSGKVSAFATTRSGTVYEYNASTKKWTTYGPSSFGGSTIPWSFVYSSNSNMMGYRFVGGLGGIWRGYYSSGSFVWEKTNALSTKDWRQLDCYSTDKIIAVASGDYFYLSGDAGVNWTPQTSAGTQSWTSVSMNGVGDSIILAYTGTSGGYVYKIGGIPTSAPNSKPTMTPTASPTCQRSCGYSPRCKCTNCVTFCSAKPTSTSTDSTAVDASSSSADTGFYSITSANGTFSNQYEGVCISKDGTNMVAAEYQGRIIYSADSGSSWDSVSDILGNIKWYAISCSDDMKTIVGVTEDGLAYYTLDQGSSWSPSSITADTFLDVKSSSDGSIVVAGGMTSLSLSTDSGATFATLDSSVGLKSTEFGFFATAASDDGTFLVACEYYGKCYVSSDTGASWSATELSNNEWIAAAVSSDGSVIAIAAVGSNLFLSTNSGSSFTETASSPKTWTSVATSSDGVYIVAVATDSSPSFSTDSGATWTDSGGADALPYTNVALASDGTSIIATSLNSQVLTGFYYSITEYETMANEGASSSSSSSSKKSSSGSKKSSSGSKKNSGSKKSSSGKK